MANKKDKIRAKQILLKNASYCEFLLLLYLFLMKSIVNMTSNFDLKVYKKCVWNINMLFPYLLANMQVLSGLFSFYYVIDVLN